jgi:hypothetical protein
LFVLGEQQGVDSVGKALPAYTMGILKGISTLNINSPIFDLTKMNLNNNNMNINDDNNTNDIRVENMKYVIKSSNKFDNRSMKDPGNQLGISNCINTYRIS